MAAGVKFCSNCGAAIGPANAPLRTQTKAEPPASSEGRPPWFPVEVYVSLALGIVFLVFGLLYFSNKVYPDGGIDVTVGLATAVSAYGINRREGWARTLGLAAGVALLVVGSLYLLVVSPLGLALFFGAFSLYYLSRKQVKAYFL